MRWNKQEFLGDLVIVWLGLPIGILSGAFIFALLATIGTSEIILYSLPTIYITVFIILLLYFRFHKHDQIGTFIKQTVEATRTNSSKNLEKSGKDISSDLMSMLPAMIASLIPTNIFDFQKKSTRRLNEQLQNELLEFRIEFEKEYATRFEEKLGQIRYELQADFDHRLQVELAKIRHELLEYMNSERDKALVNVAPAFSERLQSRISFPSAQIIAGSSAKKLDRVAAEDIAFLQSYWHSFSEKSDLLLLGDPGIGKSALAQNILTNFLFMRSKYPVNAPFPITVFWFKNFEQPEFERSEYIHELIKIYYLYDRLPEIGYLSNRMKLILKILLSYE